MSQFVHLHPEVIPKLQAPSRERIEFCLRDCWVEYSVATRILSYMEDIYHHPKLERTPHLLLIGRSDNGKSSLMREFIRRHPLLEAQQQGGKAGCVVWITMPAQPTQSQVWSEILWALMVGHRDRDPPSRKLRQVMEVMQYVGVKVLAIDEFNHVANAGKESGKLLGELKVLGNKLKIPIIASGTEASMNVLNSDIQMKTRFQQVVLDRWALDREFRSFLATYETLLPLAKPSDLASRELATKIYGMSGCAIGGIVKVIKAAAVHAIRSGRECIDAEILSSMPLIGIGDNNEILRRL